MKVKASGRPARGHLLVSAALRVRKSLVGCRTQLLTPTLVRQTDGLKVMLRRFRITIPGSSLLKVGLNLIPLPQLLGPGNGTAQVKEEPEASCANWDAGDRPARRTSWPL